MSAHDLRDDFIRIYSRYELQVNELERLEKDCNKQYKDYVRKLKAQKILQEVAVNMQQSVRLHINDIMNSAIETVFDDEYRFKLDFEIKRNKTEAVFKLLDKNDNEISIVDEVGGGLIDLISFALRIALHSMQNKHARSNTIILDEPFKFFSEDLILKGVSLLHEVSKKLEIQFIIVTHIKEFAEYADTHFEVKKIKNKSTVRVVD